MILTDTNSPNNSGTEVDLPLLKKNIDKAKVTLMMEKNTTFFAALLSNLKMLINTEFPTAATNGINLWLNPHFAAIQTISKLLGLLLHEVMHVALDHCNAIAYKNLDSHILGIAQDHYINLYITALGYEIPDDGFCDPRFTGMSSIQIYHELIKDPPPEAEHCHLDVVQIPSDMSPEEYKEIVSSNILKAALQAQINNDFGSIPEDIQILIEALTNPKLPWNLILAQYTTAYAKTNYSFRRPNKRFYPKHFLPTLRNDTIEQVTIGFDVSSSMLEDQLRSAWSEIVYLWDTLKPQRMRVMTFNTEVQDNIMYYEGDTLNALEAIGGGGTNVQPCLDSIAEENPDFALIFTDGDFCKPRVENVSSDIYWIILDNPHFIPPCGVKIDM